MNNVNDIELIDQFLQGTLSAHEAAAFSERLQNDATFQELLNDTVAAEEVVKLQELAKIKAELDNFDYSDKSSRFGNNTLTWLGVAVVSTAIIGGLLLNMSKKQESAKVAPVITTSRAVASTAVPIPLQPAKPEEKPKETSHKQKTIVLNKAIENTVAKETQAKPDQIEVKEKIAEKVIAPVIAESNTPPIVKTTDKLPLVPVKCEDLIFVKITTEPSCNDQKDGMIVINDISGGNKPYSISITDGQTIQKATKGSFNTLAAGAYNLTIKDAGNCIKVINKVEVKSKDCPVNTPKPVITTKNHLIYLSQQNWLIPACPDKGLLEIKNREDKLVYKSDVSPNDSWNMTDINGSTMSTGVYFYRLIDLETKNENVGTITVVP